MNSEFAFYQENLRLAGEYLREALAHVHVVEERFSRLHATSAEIASPECQLACEEYHSFFAAHPDVLAEVASRVVRSAMQFIHNVADEQRERVRRGELGSREKDVFRTSMEDLLSSANTLIQILTPKDSSQEGRLSPIAASEAIAEIRARKEQVQRVTKMSQEEPEETSKGMQRISDDDTGPG